MLYIVLWRSSPAHEWSTVGRAFDALIAAEEICRSFRKSGYQSRIVTCHEQPWLEPAGEIEITA